MSDLARLLKSPADEGLVNWEHENLVNLKFWIGFLPVPGVMDLVYGPREGETVGVENAGMAWCCLMLRLASMSCVSCSRLCLRKLCQARHEKGRRVKEYTMASERLSFCSDLAPAASSSKTTSPEITVSNWPHRTTQLVPARSDTNSDGMTSGEQLGVFDLAPPNDRGHDTKGLRSSVLRW